MIRVLIAQSLGEEGIKDSAKGAAYNLGSSLNSVLNKERNDLARSLLKDSMKRFFSGRERVVGREKTSPSPDHGGGWSRRLVRGLIDIGRELVDEAVGGFARGGRQCFPFVPLQLRQRVREECLRGLRLTCGSGLPRPPP